MQTTEAKKSSCGACKPTILPTLSSIGIDDYYQCPDCGQMFTRPKNQPERPVTRIGTHTDRS